MAKKKTVERHEHVEVLGPGTIVMKEITVPVVTAPVHATEAAADHSNCLPRKHHLWEPEYHHTSKEPFKKDGDI